MKLFMFPGQGAQELGMGEELFRRSDRAARRLVEEADEVLGYSIEELCLEDPRGELDQTRFTQPALYVVSALHHLRAVEDGERPDAIVGHSLGELSALYAAGCYDFRTGLELVRTRGELMSRARGGAMAAVARTTADQVAAVLEEHGLWGVELANFNTPSQIVVSGPREEIERAREALREAGYRCLVLRASGAFHSSLMEPARRQFEAHVRRVPLEAPRVPVIANVTARPHIEGEIAETLARQITHPVRWVDTLRHLLDRAAALGERLELREIGPGHVLTRLAEPIVAWHEGRTGAAEAERQVRAWNSHYPVGTRVWTGHEELGCRQTRSEARIAWGRRAVVDLAGVEGYFDLLELEPV